jgi:hypothetical protein
MSWVNYGIGDHFTPYTLCFLQLVCYSDQSLILKTEAVPETPEVYSGNSFISFEDFIRLNLI